MSNKAQKETQLSKPASGEQDQKLEGAYEFISEDLTATEPTERNERRTADEWTGIWIFESGRFSQTLMKKRRLAWFSGLPKEPSELGFDSTAGTYHISGNAIELKYTASLYPNEVGKPVTMEYSLDRDTLTLTEMLYPTKEGLTKGRRVTVLRKVQ